jgi:competence protein ComEC
VGVGLHPLLRRFVPPFDVPNAARWPRLVGEVISLLAAQALNERERWPLWLPVALGTGIGIYFSLPFEPSLPWAGLTLLAAVAFMFGVSGSERVAVRLCLSLLAAASLGFAIAKIRTEIVAAPVLSQRIGPIGIDGRVEQSELHGKGIRIVLGDLRSRKFAPGATPARVRISVRAQTTLPQPGNWVHVTAILMPPPSPASPEAYDFGRAAYFMRLGGVGYAYGRPSPIGVAGEPSFHDRVSLRIEGLRARMTERIHSILPGSTGGIASALITGNRSAISDQDEQALRDAGLAHVLAIAGLHMALVGLGLFWVIRAVLAAIPALALRYPIKKWAAGAALCSTAFYLMISGATSASTRAFVMLAMMLVAILFDRPALSMRSLAFAASIILVLGPESLIEPGFQMSFAAVMSLIAIAEWEAARDPHDIGIAPPAFAHLRRYLRGIAITSLVGSIATIPFAIYHFDRATHYAVLGNLLAMPIMGFVVMPAAAVSVLLMPFGLDAWPLRILGWGVEFMLLVGRWVSSLPGAVSVMPAWPVSALVLVSVGGLWMGLWRRRWRWLGVLPFLSGVAVAYWTPQPDLLIGRDGVTVALRVRDGSLKLFRPATDIYSADEWLKRDGDVRTASDAIATRSDGVNCDALGCVAQSATGLKIADILRPEALPEDCAAADIVVSAVPVRHSCNGPKLVVDAFDVSRNNGYAVWLGPTLRFETVEEERGRRPWSAQPKPRRTQYRRIRPTSFP